MMKVFVAGNIKYPTEDPGKKNNPKNKRYEKGRQSLSVQD